jgi:predicted O-methyltransferase YrrM
MRRNLAAAGVEHRVEIIRSTSTEAAKGWSRPIDLLFIDGDHSYEGVKNDWNLFHPFVRPGGVVLFHDTAWQLENPGTMRADMGVPRFVDELRLAGYPVITLLEHHGVSIVQPVAGGMPLCPAL